MSFTRSVMSYKASLILPHHGKMTAIDAFRLFQSVRYVPALNFLSESPSFEKGQTEFAHAPPSREAHRLKRRGAAAAGELYKRGRPKIACPFAFLPADQNVNLIWVWIRRGEASAPRNAPKIDVGALTVDWIVPKLESVTSPIG